MIEINGKEAYSGERTCPFCEANNCEVVHDVNGQEGCDECMAACELYGAVYPKEDLVEVLVRKDRGNEVIWKRGLVCTEAMWDVDYQSDWKPAPLNYFNQ